MELQWREGGWEGDQVPYYNSNLEQDIMRMWNRRERERLRFIEDKELMDLEEAWTLSEEDREDFERIPRPSGLSEWIMVVRP